MLVIDHPGACWGTAARLPKSPGIQKLTPPSSAAARSESMSEATTAVALNRNTNPAFDTDFLLLIDASPLPLRSALQSKTRPAASRPELSRCYHSATNRNRDFLLMRNLPESVLRMPQIPDRWFIGFTGPLRTSRRPRHRPSAVGTKWTSASRKWPCQS